MLFRPEGARDGPLLSTAQTGSPIHDGASPLKSPIVAFRPDPHEPGEPGAWIAELACRHGQHVRHEPPFQERLWLLSEVGRAQFLGAGLDCKECEEGAQG